MRAPMIFLEVNGPQRTAGRATCSKAGRSHARTVGSEEEGVDKVQLKSCDSMGGQ